MTSLVKSSNNGVRVVNNRPILNSINQMQVKSKIHGIVLSNQVTVKLITVKSNIQTVQHWEDRRLLVKTMMRISNRFRVHIRSRIRLNEQESVKKAMDLGLMMISMIWLMIFHIQAAMVVPQILAILEALKSSNSISTRFLVSKLNRSKREMAVNATHYSWQVLQSRKG